MKKIYKIFISSTYIDLKEERQKVIDSILLMEYLPVAMEMFSASNKRQWNIIREKIDSSDFYVLIIGKRYGSIIEKGRDSGISYTEKEFCYAKKKKIPILAFIQDKDVKITVDKIESDPQKQEKIKKFIENVTKDREVNFFSSADELAKQVVTALEKEIKIANRPGWISANEYKDEIANLKNIIKKLEEENNNLKKIYIEKIPNLKLGLKLLGSITDKENKSEGNEYNFSKIIKIKGKNVQPYHYISKKAHNYNEFVEEFRKYITKQYIDNYNKVITEKSDEIDKYNFDILLYSSIFENGQKFDFLVKNEGTAKALDIKIIIEFPKDIFVKFTDEAKNTPEPIKPDIPKSPLNKLNEERDKELYKSLGFNTIDESINKTLDDFVISKSILDSVNDSPKNFIVKIEDHKIDITIEKLLYMDSEEIDNICIIPTKTGKFDVKVSIICEEYLKPQEYTITFEVEDK